MITIDDKYIVVASEKCYIAKYLTGGKPRIDEDTGKVTPANTNIGYYNSVAGAVNGCREHAERYDIMENDYTLQEAIEKIHSITEHFNEILNKAVRA